ncbi:MAG TPA: protein translocase subunit SecD [Ktedonobacteraceae bacterium]|jgi:preprotein translocase subunit SecD|nr:protein translocase subunit SecD [Ktedonobacteraceae bacterium]
MRRGTLTLLLLIVLLAACAAYIDWPNNPGINIGFLGYTNSLKVKEGLDLQGGVQALLVPRDPQKYDPSALADNVNAARDQIEQRVNGGLGVNEPDIRVETSGGIPSIAIELPGLNSGNPYAAINSLLQTGTLEFWSTGPSGVTIGSTFDPSQYTTYNPGGQPQFTGKDLDANNIYVGQDQTGQPDINFQMKGDAVGKFYTFTQKNVGQYLTVTLDRKVIESAVIQSAINGPGQITGQFTQQQAQQIVTLLKYGALPISFDIKSEQIVGPTLGQDSITKSEIAAAIGLGIVILFMLLYYRLPGFLADCALLLYAGTTFAVFKLVGVTLSLAGIAGFILSIGMAVDANVLIFERVKEELRAGRLLSSAIDIGWKRAWPSIRDSNCSTLITCAVLYAFGSNFGATIIVGFATTLFLGVLISMFTAVVVTRTFLNLLVPTGVVSHPALFGLPAGSIATATASLSRRNTTV